MYNGTAFPTQWVELTNMGPRARRVNLQYLCQVEDIDEGAGREFRVECTGTYRFVAVFRTPRHVHAYLNSCPHQGRSLNYAPDQFLFTDEGRLVCAHHGACFDIENGKCVSGPCPGAALTPVELEIRDGSIYFVSAPSFE